MVPKVTLKGSNRVISVKVTQQFIDRAERRDSGHCMIADSVRAAIPEATSVSVDLATIRFTDPAKRQRFIYLTPLAVQQALVDFDQEAPTQAFSFQLRKAVQVVESGKRTSPDGTSQRPSRAVQKVVGAAGRKQPIKLGGDLPPKGALSSTPSRSKRAAAAAQPPTTTARVPDKKLTAAEKRAAAVETAKAQAAARDRGEPVTKTGSNITLAQTRGRVRRFGMRQLRA